MLTVTGTQLAGTLVLMLLFFKEKRKARKKVMLLIQRVLRMGWSS
jgi:hypothetical protein